MSSKHFPLLALPLLALACGGDDGKIDIEQPSIENPVAYFGVAPCTCYEYTSSEPSELRTLGVAVERVDDFYSDERGHDVYTMVYRLSGQPAATYVVEPTKSDLVLSRVQPTTGGADDEWWRLSPAMSLTHWLEDQGEAVVKKVEATLFRNASPVGEPEQREIKTLKGDRATVRASIDGGEEKDWDATVIEYQNTPWGEPKRWFVPEVGNVQLEFQGVRWQLKKKRTLAGECRGEKLTDTCGT